MSLGYNRNGLTRRSFGRLSLAAGAAAGAGLTASGVQQLFTPSIASAKTGEIYGMGVRKAVHTLTEDSDDVRIYRDVVAWMRKRSDENPLDPMGWLQHWQHHSMFCATNSFSLQVHYGWFFLPWHRAYLANLEQKIRRVAQEPAFALPYWDWTRDPRMPEWYTAEGSSLVNTTRYQEGGDVVPADFIELGPSLRAKTFDHFGGRKRVPGDVQVEGTLEQGVHNNIHNWVGGELASFDGAGNDPIFQSHHGQIDRVWDIWLAQGEGRANPTDPEWLEHQFWLYGASGLPEVIPMTSLLSTEEQGYRYDDLEYRHTLTPENTPKLDWAAARDHGVVALTDDTLAKIDVVRRGEGPGRVSINYERLSVPIHPFQHRLFFVNEATGAATFVGTFTILPIPDLTKGLERTITSQVEVPPAALDSLISGGRVRIVGVGVPLKGREIPTQPVPFSGVSLSVEA